MSSKMEASIDNKLLRQMSGSEYASYFRQLRKNGMSEATITAHLLDAVDRQSMSPMPLMSVWLSFAQSPTTVKICLSQTFSLCTRKFALHAFIRMLSHRQWRSLWKDFGEVEGIVELFSHLSVLEIDQITRAIGKQLKAGRDSDRDAQISALLRALLASSGIDAAQRTSSDQRLLVEKYLEILPGCDVSFVEDMLCEVIEGIPKHTWSLRYFSCHSTLIARLTVEYALGNGRLPDDRFGPCLTYCMNGIQQGLPIEPGHSISMSFGMRLLRRLAAEENDRISENCFLQSLVEPLISQFWKRRKLLGYVTIHEIIDLSIKYMRQRSKHFKQLQTNEGSFFRRVVQCWGLEPDKMEEALSFVVQRCIFQLQTTVKGVTDLAKLFLRTISTERRYQFLRKLFMELSSPSVDINKKDQLSQLNDVWDHEVFTLLPHEHALQLLARLRQAKPELNLFLPFWSTSLQASKTIVFCPTEPTSVTVDTNLLYHILRRGQDGALKAVTECFVQQKNKAMTSREQTERAFYARATFFVAIASGSLPLLKDSLVFLRRYVRDALTVKTLYGESTFGTRELIDVLAAVPEAPSKQDSFIQVAEAVSEANTILLYIYETVCQALKEPSFYEPDWRGPLALIRSVVEKRFDRVKALQQVLRLSDDRLYDSVWKSTLEMLVNVESSAVDEGHVKLDFCKPSGPLSYRGMAKTDPKKATPASFRFVDELARARDEIWQGVRRFRSPSVAALPGPWPRGLTILQMATSLDIVDQNASGCTPYLDARAKSVVFMQEATALADPLRDEETTAAVDIFIDNFKAALRIYVLQEPASDAKRQLLQKAWRHAIQSFTHDRMSPDEKIRYINDMFSDVLPECELPPSAVDQAKSQLYPLLPDVTDPDEVTEWTPLESKPKDIKTCSVQYKTIDYVVSGYSNWNAPRWNTPPGGYFETMTVTIPGWAADPIWSFNRFSNIRRLPVRLREGLVISRLLYLDSQVGGSNGLLAAPFPSDQDVRYPSLFLDSEFLLREDLGYFSFTPFTVHVAPDLIRRLVDKTMKQLVVEEERIKNEDEGQEVIKTINRQVKSLFSLISPSKAGFYPSSPPAFGSGRGAFRDRGRGRGGCSIVGRQSNRSFPNRPISRVTELELILYDLVVFLASGDRPKLAADLIVQIIIDRPDASSWHRSLLGITYLRRLPHAEIRVFFADFVQRLIDRFAEQEAHKSDKNWKKPHIKITTLKYVAQLLDGVEFVSRIDAVNILVKLYDQAQHIDVRFATVESLLGMLASCREPATEPVAKVIMDGLRNTVPLLGCPSERRQLEEKDWLQAEKTGILPEVIEDSPITNLLIDVVADKKWSININYRKAMLKQILEPAIEGLARSNERWTKLFAAKHGVSFKTEEISKQLLAYPIKPALIESLLTSCPELTPAQMFQDYHDHSLAIIKMTSDFKTLIEKVQGDGELRFSNEGKTFLSLYNKRIQSYRDATIAFSLLRGQRLDSLLEHGGITLERVQESLLDLASEFMKQYDEEPEHFDIFVNHLKPSFQLDPKPRQEWTRTLKPVLTQVIISIYAARLDLTASSRPSVLPSIFKLKLWLLPWPTAVETSIRPFTTAIISIIGNLVKSESPTYYTQYGELGEMLQSIPTMDLQVQIALELGDLVETRDSRTQELIRGLQVWLLQQVSGAAVRAEVLARVQELVQRWIVDKDEETRRRGFVVKRAAESAKILRIRDR